MGQERKQGSPRTVQDYLYWGALAMVACGAVAFFAHMYNSAQAANKVAAVESAACLKVAQAGAASLAPSMNVKTSVLGASVDSLSAADEHFTCRVQTQSTAGQEALSKETWILTRNTKQAYMFMYARIMGVDQTEALNRSAFGSKQEPSSRPSGV